MVPLRHMCVRRTHVNNSKGKYKQCFTQALYKINTRASQFYSANLNENKQDQNFQSFVLK